MADLTPVVADALAKQADNKSNDLTAADATKITPQVSKEVNKEVNAIVTNITNQEPWYQSRVIIGAAISMIAQLARVAGVQLDITPEDQEAVVNLALSVLSLAGVAFALYGRMVVQKPMGQ